jgi:hypothetical protein
MTASRRLVLILQLVTVSAIAASAALLAWPAATTVTPIAPVLPALVAGVPAMAGNAATLTDSIVNANMFSLTREAPAARTFAAAPIDPLVMTPSTDSGSLATETTESGDSDPVPSLYGVVNGPQGAAALLRLDPARRGSRLYHLGEGMAGYRVRSIGSDRVELDGPNGATVLTLTTRGGTP